MITIINVFIQKLEIYQPNMTNAIAEIIQKYFLIVDIFQHIVQKIANAKVFVVIKNKKYAIIWTV